MLRPKHCKTNTTQGKGKGKKGKERQKRKTTEPIKETDDISLKWMY
jgi:hypothetical protein